MTLEERFEALMKNCEHLQAQNEEMANQNAYLRRQLGESMRQRRKEIRSSSSSIPSESVQGEGEGDEPIPVDLLVMVSQQDIQEEGEDFNPTSMTLGSKFRSLKAS